MSSKSETPLPSSPPAVSRREPLRPSGSKPFATDDLNVLFKHVVKFLSHGFDDPSSTTLKIPHDLYEDLLSKLEKHGRKLRYSYDHASSIMTVAKPPSEIHESPSEFLNQILCAARGVLKEHSIGRIRILAGGRPLKDVENPDKPGRWLEMRPDGMLKVRVDGEKVFPGLLLEVGYTQSYKNLLLVTRQWLLGSAGKVKSVLLIKFEKPKLEADFGDMKKWEGYLEVWVQAATESVDENGSSTQQIGPNDLLPIEGKTPTHYSPHTEDPRKDDSLSDTEEQRSASDHPPQSPNDSDKSSPHADTPPDNSYAPSHDSDQYPETIDTKGITRSVDRLYFLHPEESVANPLVFELCIADIIGKATLPEIADQRLKVDLVSLLEEVKDAIKSMARMKEQRKRRASNHKGSNDAEAGPGTKRQKH